MTIVAAEPGYQLAVINGKRLDHIPIIGWAVLGDDEDDFRTCPVTCGYFNSGPPSDREWAVRSPDGRYHFPCGTVFADVDEAMAHAIDMQAAVRELNDANRARSRTPEVRTGARSKA